MKIVTAKFIGEDGSMGFKNGKKYTLTLSKCFFGMGVYIESSDHHYCPYASFMTFLNNWTDIKCI